MAVPRAKEAVVIRLRRLAQTCTAEQELALAVVIQAVLDIGALPSDWDRDDPDSSADWVYGTLDPWCLACGIHPDYARRLLCKAHLL